MGTRGFIRVFLLVSFLCAPVLRAQDNTEVLNRMKAMEDRIKALEAEVQSLKGQPPPRRRGATASRPMPPAATRLSAAPAMRRTVDAGPDAGGAAARRPRR